MSEEYKVQVSVKNQRGDMLNLRGQTVAEVAAIVEEASGASVFQAFFPRQNVETVTATDVTMTPEQAQTLVTEHLGPGTEEPATPAQVTYLVKLGVSAQEARSLSKKAASARISELKGAS